MEIWKDIQGYEKLYQISSKGGVKSLWRWNGSRHKKRESPYIMTPSLTSTGYIKIELTKDGITKTKKVHRLVGEAFIINPDNKPEINHIDGNPLNNSVENLEWCTRHENVMHAIETGLRTYKRDEINIEDLIKDYKEKVPTSKIMKKYGVSQNFIYYNLRANNICIRTISESKDKYGIDLNELLDDFKKGKRNKDLEKKYNCSKGIIAVRKHQFRKAGKLK